LETETGEEPEDMPYSLSLSPALNRNRRLTAVKAVYRAGYAYGEAPPDLASACLELAAWNMSRYRGPLPRSGFFIGMTGNIRGTSGTVSAGECAAITGAVQAEGYLGMTDMTDKELFIEEKLLNSVKKLLSGRVNELLGKTQYPIPPVEFGSYRGGSAVVPVVALSTCERSEKERIVRLDAYTLTITFTVPEHPEGDRNCYAYAASVATALGENPTLSGAASRAELTGKKYAPPKRPGTGVGWEIILTLRITIEGDDYGSNNPPA
jgi:hypothetical protein